jgi:hypothetical protein
MKNKFILLFIFWFFAFNSNSQEFKKVSASFPRRSLDLDLADFTKLGEKLIEFSIFSIDVYVVSYYEKTPSIKPKGRAINLNYKMNVSKNLSIKGWEEGFKWMTKSDLKRYKDAISWIYNSTVNLLKGDNLTIFVVDGETIFKKNLKTISVSHDPLVGEIVLSPWVGKKPIREDVKKALLGK